MMLSIKQLNKTYANGVQASNNLSLEIKSGIFFNFSIYRG